MRLRLANLCRCRVLAIGAAASCLYLFLLDALLPRQITQIAFRRDGERTRPNSAANNGKLENGKKTSATITFSPPHFSQVPRFGRRPGGNTGGVVGPGGLGQRLSHRLMVFCTNMSYQVPPGPLTALASFPGSGNTWIRYLVQQATGLYTGSVYRDQGLLLHGFPAENVKNGSVLMVKTHEWGSHIRSNYSRAVLIIREPLSSILAEFNRQGGGHVGHAPIDKFVLKKGKVWRDFVSGKSRSWMEMNLDWLKFDGPLHVICYENFTTNVESELGRLLAFLNLTVSKETMKCVLKNQEGNFKRKKKQLNFDPFTSEMYGVLDKYQQIVKTAYKLFVDNFRTHLIDFIDSVLVVPL